MPKCAPKNRGHYCDACGKSLSTNSHLRRHEALHNGRISAICPFCNKQFSRLDTARRHVKTCSPDGVDILVADTRRGKTRQACDACAQRKLSCDTAFPCVRCVSSKVMCTYQRRIFSDLTSLVDTSTETPGLSAAARSVEKVSDASRGRIPIQFLLAFTAPGAHEATTTLVTASRKQSIGQALTAPLGSPTSHEFNFECYDTLFWDQENWTPSFIDYFSQNFMADVDRHSHSSSQCRFNSIIGSRLAHMRLQLASTHATMFADNPNSQTEFEEKLAEQVFTTTNLENFVQAYFRQLHRYYPIVHRPSFDYETVSLPLVLAIFLFGSLCSAPSDSTQSARKFFDVAEEYIFRHPTMQQLHQEYTNCVWSEEGIGVLQAALIIEIVQNGTNNVETRRRLRIKRHPWFIATLRSCGLLQATGGVRVCTSGTGQSRWQSFISKEIRTRLAVWAFVIDSCFAIMFNSCPLLTIAELDTDSPCCEEVFEAETVTDYENLVTVDSPESSRQTLSQLTKDLLRDTWINDAHKHVTAMHLMVTICALQSLSMMSRYSLLLQVTENTILRAADRWEDLWHTVTKGNRSGTHPQQGFVEHSEELCWFVRTLVHAGQLEVSDCHYTRIVPTDNIKDLHDFLCRYKMT